MTKNKIYFGILILILLLFIAGSSYSMLYVGKTQESHKVSVIVINSNSDRWTSLRQGLEQAAADYNIDINYVSTGQSVSTKDEIELINLEMDNGAEGIIVQMNSADEYKKEMELISSRVSLMLLETDINPEDVYAYTGPDNSELGRAVANAIKDEYGSELAGKRIGILYGNQNQLSMQQRLDGLREVLSGEEVNIVWETEGIMDIELRGMQQMEEKEPVDIMIALGNEETEKMVDYMQRPEREGKECALFGVGSSEKVVYYLDKGMINTLVVPNDFSMGYQSMEAIARMLQYRLSETDSNRVDYLIVNKNNLYDAENQKVLFPIVQ